MDVPYLVTLSLVIPAIGTLVTILVGGRNPDAARKLALAFSLPPLALSTLALVSVYLRTATMNALGYGYYERYDWIPALNIHVIFGLDGISAPMFFLTALLVTLGIVFSWDHKERAGLFFGLLLLIDVSVLGVFASLDLFLFYIFWEVTLVPMYFLIAIWGGARRRYAAIKFFVYTFIASLVMLLGFMALYFETGTFEFTEIQRQAPTLSAALQKGVFLALFVGFATKFPVVPVHTWLPDAHVEAPTAGSVILAGVLLKMGSYGLIRIGLPMAPFGAKWAVPIMFVIAVLSMIYASIICLAQRDYKKLVAYSSIGTMGLVLLGIAASAHTGGAMGLVGANFMMLAHGFISPALFMLCGVLQHNIGTREIPLMGGLATRMPRTAVMLVTFSLAGLGLPGLAAFIGEFQIYAGAWEAFGLLLFIPLAYLVLSAAYYLWALQRSMFGPFEEKEGVDYHHVYDVHAYEALALGALFALTLLYGIWPDLLTRMLSAPVEGILGSMGGV